MGTSGPYTPSPNWSGIKTDITNALNGGPVTDQEAHDLVRDFVDQLCDEDEEGLGTLPNEIGRVTPEKAVEKLAELLKNYPVAPTRPPPAGRSSGQTEGRGGASKLKGRSNTSSRSRGNSRSAGGAGRAARGSIRPAAQRLATFISEIPKVGLRQALLDTGVVDIDKLPPEQIALAIADVLAADANTIVQTELRDALATVLERVCANPDSIDTAEERLNASAYDLQTVVQMLFECYIVERFKTFFSEHEAAKHGYDAADKLVDEAREYVSSEMALERADRHDLTAVDWGSEEGAEIVDGILSRTIAIYTL